MSRRILLLSAEFGSGHLAAARAIATLCRAMDPTCEAEPVQMKSPLLNLFSRAYLWLIEYFPSFYRRLYHMPVGWPMRAFVLLVLSRIVRRQITRFQPDLIVGTHPFPARVAAHLRNTGRLHIPVVMALTDFLPHGFWVCDGVDHYCVSSEAAREALIRLGVDRSRIAVTGVAIHPAFAEAGRQPPTRSADDPCRRVLVMGGGLGLGPIVEAVNTLASLPQPELQVTVISGTNRSLELQLRERFTTDPRIAVVGFTSQVAEHMAKSDLLVTKPGGITCSEALAVGLPMLLLSPLPGHEEENASFLVQTGAAVITNARTIGAATAGLLFIHPEQLESMKEKARMAGRPRSAEAIANELFIQSARNAHPRATVG